MKKKIKIKFKKEYEDLLREEKLLDKFTENFIRHCKSYEYGKSEMNEALELTNKSPSFMVFFTSAFFFGESKEGKDFWTKKLFEITTKDRKKNGKGKDDTISSNGGYLSEV